MIFACAATLSTQRSTDMGWRRSRNAASRIEGRFVASAFHAAARAARSLSVKDSATMSAGVCRRSTGSTRSSSEADVVVRMCMAELLSPQNLLDGDAVQPLQPDHHQPRAAVVVGGPGAVIIVVDARADGLDQEPHRLAADIDEAFY